MEKKMLKKLKKLQNDLNEVLDNYYGSFTLQNNYEDFVPIVIFECSKDIAHIYIKNHEFIIEPLEELDE